MYSLVDSYRHFKYEFVYTFGAESSMRQPVPANIWYPFTKNHECLALGSPFACTSRNRINIFKIQECKSRNSLIAHVDKQRERKRPKIFNATNPTDQETGKYHLDKCNWRECSSDFVKCCCCWCWWW
jgi:hypothetical protein